MISTIKHGILSLVATALLSSCVYNPKGADVWDPVNYTNPHNNMIYSELRQQFEYNQNL